MTPRHRWPYLEGIPEDLDYDRAVYRALDRVFGPGNHLPVGEDEWATWAAENRKRTWLESNHPTSPVIRWDPDLWREIGEELRRPIPGEWPGQQRLRDELHRLGGPRAGRDDRLRASARRVARMVAEGALPPSARDTLVAAGVRIGLPDDVVIAAVAGGWRDGEREGWS